MRSKHNPACGKNKKEERFILMKKLLSVVLALLMLAVMLPVTAMAADGDGSSSSPYTLAQFNKVPHGNPFPIRLHMVVNVAFDT